MSLIAENTTILKNEISESVKVDGLKDIKEFYPEVYEVLSKIPSIENTRVVLEKNKTGIYVRIGLDIATDKSDINELPLVKIDKLKEIKDLIMDEPIVKDIYLKFDAIIVEIDLDLKESKKDKTRPIEESVKISSNIKNAVDKIISEVKREIKVPVYSILIGKITKYKVDGETYKSFKELKDDGLDIDLQSLVEAIAKQDPYFMDKKGFSISGRYSAIDERGNSFRVYIEGKTQKVKEGNMFNLKEIDNIDKIIGTAIKGQTKAVAFDEEAGAIIATFIDKGEIYLINAIITLEEDIL